MSARTGQEEEEEEKIKKWTRERKYRDEGPMETIRKPEHRMEAEKAADVSSELCANTIKQPTSQPARERERDPFAILLCVNRCVHASLTSFSNWNCQHIRTNNRSTRAKPRYISTDAGAAEPLCELCECMFMCPFYFCLCDTKASRHTSQVARVRRRFSFFSVEFTYFVGFFRSSVQIFVAIASVGRAPLLSLPLPLSHPLSLHRLLVLRLF